MVIPQQVQNPMHCQQQDLSLNSLLILGRLCHGARHRDQYIAQVTLPLVRVDQISRE